MSFAFIVMMMLLSSSVVIAFVLQPSKEEPATSANVPVSQHRCHGESLQSIRKGLLRALNLESEPWMPAGGLDRAREQWKSTFNTISQRTNETPVPTVSGYSVSPDSGNSMSQCCSMASEIFMKDLGWDNWVIHPASLTIVQCALCNPELTTVQCPLSPTNVQDANSQVPCCQPTAEEMVPLVYVDAYSNLVISSVQLTRSCGCGPGNIQQPSEE
ncbi:growth/differentiation factor 6-B-like [Mastacembelus armatus]|uniref:Gonadal somatic cell derived factor n=1 Tax=Mastacembelus armatus TaxID=205130 RepID=A0A3Q3MAN8_9TELE|nr:growth/differentiation factor 6-B-like [Mastacembelus armatus]